MPGKKKKFINKNDAVTFHLVHRSQRDPLQADDEAPQHVLLDANTSSDSQEKRHIEQRKYGVYYTDDYDYMQHLCEVDDLHQVALDEKPAEEITTDKESKISLPSSVFGSSMETNVGLLNKAVLPRGPQPDWDPDIVAALDDDFDFDNPMNQLEDNFMELANPRGLEGDLAMGDDGDIASDEADMSDNDDIGSDCGNFSEESFSEEETRSRFTAYSMTSSVMRRNDGLTLLDDRFERLYEQYDDEEIGALDQDEIEGAVQQKSAVLNSVMEEFEQQQKVTTLKDIIQKAEDLKVASGSSDESDLEPMEKVVEAPKPQWDCESIISTYSNLYNHPKRIDEPNKPRKPRQLSVRSDISQESCVRKERAEPVNTLRPKNETSDEKRLRKKAVKEERKLRRMEKKATKLAYKTEEMRQSKEMMNIRNNLQSVKVS